MAAVRGDHDDNKSRIRTERAQERIKSHPFKRHGTKKKKGTAGPEARIRFGNRDQNGGVRKEFGCKGFSLNYRL